MYIHIHTYTHTYIHTYIHTHICVYIIVMICSIIIIISSISIYPCPSSAVRRRTRPGGRTQPGKDIRPIPLKLGSLQSTVGVAIIVNK